MPDHIHTIRYASRPKPWAQNQAAEPNITLHSFRLVLYLQCYVTKSITKNRARSTQATGSRRTSWPQTSLLVDLLLERRLQPYLSNVGKRLVKSPKLYIRDSGLLHALLNVLSLDDLLGHPVAGGSWEGFVIENLLQAAPARSVAGFYRTSGGAEIDLVLELPGGNRWAIEIKRGTDAKPNRGFHEACLDLSPTRRLLVHSGKECYPLKNGVEAISLSELAFQLAES